MICSHLVNLSLLFGAVLSWGVMWPLIAHRKGDWFPGDIKESSMKSLSGYKVFLQVSQYVLSTYFDCKTELIRFMQVFISIALILGDGLYNFAKTILFTAKSMHAAFNKNTHKSGELASFLFMLCRLLVFSS